MNRERGELTTNFPNNNKNSSYAIKFLSNHIKNISFGNPNDNKDADRKIK
jgi:hypothetical protein